MFNIGPMELLVLAIVGLIVLGPERLPDLARDAARMIKTLRELANGAREQLRDELGPEFADVDLRNLNPRTAITRAVLGDDVDLRGLTPRAALQRTLLGPDESSAAAAPAAEPTAAYGEQLAPTSPPATATPSRSLAPGEQAPYDTDAT